MLMFSILRSIAIAVRAPEAPLGRGIVAPELLRNNRTLAQGKRGFFIELHTHSVSFVYLGDVSL